MILNPMPSVKVCRLIQNPGSPAKRGNPGFPPVCHVDNWPYLDDAVSVTGTERTISAFSLTIAMTGTKRSVSVTGTIAGTTGTHGAVTIAVTVGTVGTIGTITVRILAIAITIAIATGQGYDRCLIADTVAISGTVRSQWTFAVGASGAFRIVRAFTGRIVRTLTLLDLIAVARRPVFLASLVLVLIAASHGDYRKCQQQGQRNN